MRAEQLGASLHPGRTVRAVVEAAVPTLADTAVVFLPIRGAWTAWHRAGPDRASGRTSVSHVEEAPLVAKALRSLLTEPARCGRSELLALADALSPWRDADGQALVVPLPGAGAPSGVLVLARGSPRPGFDAADTDLARDFAARAGMAAGRRGAVHRTGGNRSRSARRADARRPAPDTRHPIGCGIPPSP